jgi:hypothetical protein
LGVGEAIMTIPHEKGTKTVKIKFSKTDDLDPLPMPKTEKTMMRLLDVKTKNKSEDAKPDGSSTGSPVSVTQLAHGGNE